MIHVLLGTKAQYLKTAPLLWRFDQQAVPYRLVDVGQHARLSVGLRSELGIRSPDLLLGGDRDVTSIPQAVVWSSGLAGRLFSRRRLRAEVFADAPGLAVVHGDTPSTLLSALMARRSGLPVAHLEAGLRSGHLLHPFPEELIRVVVMRWSNLLFAPDATAAANLKRMGVAGRVIRLAGNTSLETLRRDLGDPPPPGSGPAVVTMHRVENLHRRRRVAEMVGLVEKISATGPVTFVLHEPTIAALARRGDQHRLAAAGVELMPLQPHRVFSRMLSAARLVVTDGGSIQEECALLGVPTLLWRGSTERRDGIDANVVLSRYRPEVVDRFVADPDRYRRPLQDPVVSPSEQIFSVLIDAAGEGARAV
jgi:UDP-N-acetylglucosamine 2-epimerase (non-hydrolysing)